MNTAYRGPAVSCPAPGCGRRSAPLSYGCLTHRGRRPALTGVRDGGDERRTRPPENGPHVLPSGETVSVRESL